MKRSDLVGKLIELKMSIGRQVVCLELSCKILGELIQRLEKVEDGE